MVSSSTVSDFISRPGSTSLPNRSHEFVSLKHQVTAYQSFALHITKSPGNSHHAVVLKRNETDFFAKRQKSASLWSRNRSSPCHGVRASFKISSSAVSQSVTETANAKVDAPTSLPPRPDTPKIHRGIDKLVGSSPMVYARHVTARCCAHVACKMEAFQPCRSVKDRIALAMIEDAEERGLISPGTSTLVEATSGNTGVGLAYICALKGYKLLLCMPEDQSIERRILVQAFGAQVVLTPKNAAMTGSIRKAEELCRKVPGAHSLQQFQNPANPRVHYETTGPEIWKDTKGKIDFLVAGVGTGGTISGCGEYLKQQNRLIQIVGVEPAESAVLSGGRPGYHQIQGIGAGFIPELLNSDVLDEVVKVSSRDAFATARQLHQREGLMVGISSGAAMHAAIAIGMRPENEGKLIVCILSSHGERYISTPLFAQAWRDNLAEEERMPVEWKGVKDLDDRKDGPGRGAGSAL
eukprot:TRINITY_DN2156_c0_g1_i1.p1 TRINITY_DN2156_c0_g1~~TRINITY_DN2156_c0_g1_i1.p1  ORF type:complete len:466 (-),score=53.87 TRINITY_DN2156_c0_g1_i1:459-1856(-)